MSLQQLNNIFARWFGLTLTIVVQYFFLCCMAFFIFYVWKKKAVWYAHIQQKYPDNKHIKREIWYSFTSVLILGAVLTLVVWLDKNNYTLAYKPIDKYGWGYYFFSVLLMVILHDAYFYWGHRLLHWGPFFKYIHKLHHMSVNPTPFAAYSLHPIEAVIQMSIVLIIDFTIPHHQSAILIFGTYSLMMNMGGHLGYEFFPRWFARHKLLKWHNTSTHHNLHHTNVKTNYSFYFNFWDYLMKTGSRGYEEQFESHADRRAEARKSSKELQHTTAIIE